MKELIKQLNSLKSYGIVGIKQSFEDEGALIDDVVTMRRITELSELYLNVKIGGCEAISDIHTCIKIGVDNIVAPMIESEFALQKFIESVLDVKNINFYINIESKTAYENLDNIFQSPSSKLLKGIVVGRSDLTKSYGYYKNDVDSENILNITYDIMKKSKSYGFNVLMGGNISTKSCKFIKQLYTEGILDFIETRNVIIKLNDSNINNLLDVIKLSLIFESNWLNYKAKYYNSISSEYINRSTLILTRAENDK